jgi:hypothetical protein
MRILRAPQPRIVHGQEAVRLYARRGGVRDGARGRTSRGAVSSAAASFDPATLALTGWWRAPYAGSPWAGTASAGSSGGVNLAEGTNPPAVGNGARALNGLDTCDPDGVNDLLTPGLTLASFVAAGAGSLWCLFNADAAFATTGNPYDAPQFFCAQNLRLSFGFDSGGVWAHIYDGGHKAPPQVACATNGWHLAQMKFDGTTLSLRVDSGAWSSVAAGNIDDRTGAVLTCVNFGVANFLNGRIADLGVGNAAFANATFDSLKNGYINPRYALSL